MNIKDIKPGLMVHAEGEGADEGAPGVHVGTVDGVEKDYVKLKKSDSTNNRHRWFPITWVERVDDKAVYVNKSADDFQAEVLPVNPAAA